MSVAMPQCVCTECDCDLYAPEGICIACRNGCCGTVPRCGRTEVRLPESEEQP